MVSAPREQKNFFSGGWGTTQTWKQLNCFFVVFFSQIVSVLTGKFESFIKQCVIIDCRYPYEYEGGHIKVSWPHRSRAGGLKLQPKVTCIPMGLIFIQGHVDMFFLRESCHAQPLPGFGYWVMEWLFLKRGDILLSVSTGGICGPQVAEVTEQDVTLSVQHPHIPGS